MINENEKRAMVRLHLAEGVGTVLFRRLMDAFGSAEKVFAASVGQWRGVEQVGQKKAQAIAKTTWEDADEEISIAKDHGVNILTLDDAEYPDALKKIYDPPAMLYVRGRIEQTDAISIGIVGARHCTHYGMEQAERFGRGLARAGFTVVSGGARGIDTAAHHGALSAEGRTIAVMGCGLCKHYPPENEKLFHRIVDEDRGALISELPMRTSVLSGNFPMRNRIISGLSLGSLVVEAGQRSGALITATEAAEQGRTVFAVPGRVDSPMSAGTHELIRQGATLVSNLEDILDELGCVGEKMTPDEAETQKLTERTILEKLDKTESALFAELSEGTLSLDELARRTSLSSGQAAASLTMLVLKGAVTQKPGNIFARKR